MDLYGPEKPGLRGGARRRAIGISGVAWGLSVLTGARADDASLAEVTVSGERLELIGTASTASEGVVVDQEIQQTPAYRPGQILETVPGLIVTLHSGEGKANQFLMRGYNLDHGTDLATLVDGMPINQPTHAHGQGYTDLNFLLPEMADKIRFTKGPYYATVGDFGAVGSLQIAYRDAIPDQFAVTVGTLDYQRVFAAGTQSLADGKLLAAAEFQHYDGPFTTPDDARRENAVLRYSQGDEHNGYSVTGMFYHQLWTSTTDIPLRAIDEGVVSNRFGTLDPTDGGRAQRASVSMQIHQTGGDGQFSASTYFIDNQLHLFNDFTHFLVDPVHGDQEEQFENRRVVGGAASYSLPVSLGLIDNEFAAGMLMRYDWLGVGRLPSAARVPLPPQDDPPSFSNSDDVYLFGAAAYLQATTRWTSTIRSVFGLRDDYQHGTDIDYLARLHETAGYSNGGTAAQSLLQPKGSLIYTPSQALEFYLSAGRGFHSADLRGVNQDMSVNLGLPHTPLLAKQDGQEVGVRAAMLPNLVATVGIYNLWQQSETILNPDIGQDTAGPPSRRYGYEVNLTYQINRRLEFYGSYSGDHTRFTRSFDDGTGHSGTYITDAPVATGSVALYVTNLWGWSAGLDYRYLGNYPLSSGPCVDSAAVRDFPGVAHSCGDAPTAFGQVNGHGFGELNLDVQHAFPSGWVATVGIYNLFDSSAAAAEFWYVDRLQSEHALYPDGRADLHQHPLEPRALRFTISRHFGI
jgi:outer membrane receptor protein involved in Fe transport